MHFLLTYEFVPDYLERRAAHRNEHLRVAWSSSEQGALLLGGAFAEPADGAALIFQADSVHTVEEFIAADPYVREGLVKHWRIRQWTTVVGAGAMTPVYPSS